MSAYLSKYHIGLNGNGYIISQNRNGVRYYQKKRAPAFVNKFGGGDSAYRDATFWQYFVQTNWRNGAKQLKFDDPGKFWKSENVDTTILEELKLSKSWSSAGQLEAGIKVNAMEAWRSSTSWFNANYGYRQQLTITAPSGVVVPAGHPVKITIDTAALESGGKVRSDRKDWRVVYDNGSTQTELFRHYVSTTATFFALQEAISAGGSTSSYYVYYGYASESTSKEPSTDADWNAVYGMYGTTPDANTQAIFHFREGSGTTVNDDTTNANNGTLTGSPAWGTDGKFGKYVDFDGSNDRMSFANLSLGSATIEGWAYFDTISGTQSIASQAKSDGSASWQLSRGGNKITFRVNSGSDTTITSSTTVTTGTWYHIAATNDGSTIKLFIDGAQVASGSAGAFEATTDTIHLGVRHESSFFDYFNGRLQHWRFSNTARTSFAYALSSEPSVTGGNETTTQPPSSSFDLYAGGTGGKVYKWDGGTTWEEQFDCRRLEWYETGQDTDKVIGDTGGTETAQSQGFQLPYDQSVKAVQVYLKKSTGTPGDITVRIETNSTDKPSGTLAHANATATIPAFSTTTYGWITVEFDEAFTLSDSTTYHLVLKTAAAANDNYYHWGADGSSPTYADGDMSASTDGGSTWSAVSAADAYFRILGNETDVNCMKVTSQGGTQRLYIGTGLATGETNGDARLYAFDGTNWTLRYTFTTATESMVLSIEEYTANSKVYVGLGPQAKVYQSSDMASFTISKDINVPQNPGYPHAMKEYNRVLHVGGGSPEFLPTQFYNGFLNVYDTTQWNILYPFDFTVIKSLEFYDAYLFMGTYRGDLYVYDTSTLNPLFNFRDQYAYGVEIKSMKYFDDKLYIGLYPQENSNETNVGIWLFDRRGLSLAHTISGVEGYRCFAVINGTLMVGTGDDGYVYKLNSNTYVTQGWYQSSYFDANLPSIPKLYNEITIRHDPLAEGQSIVVYYKFKEADDWTTLGTSDTLGAIEKSLAFNTGVSANKISLKVELNTTNTSSSPKLTEVVMQYSLYPERKWQWTLRLKAKKNLRLLDNTFESRTAEEIRTDLEELLAEEQLYTFTDIDGTTYSVLTHDIDSQSWVVNQGDVNEDEVLLTLLEA